MSAIDEVVKAAEDSLNGADWLRPEVAALRLALANLKGEQTESAPERVGLTPCDPRIYGNPVYLRGLLERVKSAYFDREWKAVERLFEAEIEEMETRASEADSLIQSLRERVGELEAKLNFAGNILGKICVYGTLVIGEKPVDPPPHAAVDAILTQIERAEVAERELSFVDAALTRRPAVADAPNRYTAIFAAFNMASRTDAAERMVKHWEMHYGIQLERADKLQAEIAALKGERDAIEQGIAAIGANEGKGE